jgi:pyruvate/2-oxoglutarate dehydrogenase complex dihydrolipoamide dehydrogenase (E3) component
VGVVHRPDICVVGAGSGGLSVAAGAVQMGASVVVIERAEMGGDCLNTGCVPSKALLAAAKAAHHVRTAGRFGVDGREPSVDFAAVHRHVHRAIAAIAPHDSQERFEGLGATVLRATARFVSPTRIETDLGDAVEARRFVIATGSRPSAPPIPGLADVPFLTNETVFARTSAPGHLVILGGGAIGCEMAQAHRRLGARVTLVERDRILHRDDPDLVEIVRRTLLDEGVDLREGAEVIRVEPAGTGVAVVARGPEGEARIEGTHLLVAVGRTVDLDALDPEAGNVARTPRGVDVDEGLRSRTNRRVYAVGDAAGGPQFTHVAGYHASVVIRSALFRLPAKVDYRALPRVTFTDPELAAVGAIDADARAEDPRARELSWPLRMNDRAQAEGETDGLVKAWVRPDGRILGAAIAAPHAGELIGAWALAIHGGLKIGAVAQAIMPYPTLSEASKRAAGSFYAEKLFGATTRRVVRFLSRFG